MGAFDFPRWFVAQWLCSMLLRRPGNAGADGARLLAQHPTAVIGLEHLPRSRRFLLVMNHYERPGLRVWWPALLVSRAVWQAPQVAPPPSVRWLITNRFYRFRLGRIRLPGRLVGWFLARVAGRYGAILVARPAHEAAARAVALRRARRALDGREPQPVASTPEGERGGGRSLVQPVPGSGKALAWLSRGEVPIVPAGVYEDASGRLVARFGRPFLLPWPGLRLARREQEAMAGQVMRAIAECLPLEYRGPYRDYAESAADGEAR